MGANDRGDASPVGVVSPHFDDAVLSCGALLAAHPGSTVVTVFSAGPRHVDPLPPWDFASGLFRPGDDVMARRRQEDDDALAHLAANGRRLELWDSQYRHGPRRRWPARLGRWLVPRPPDGPVLAAMAEERLDAVLALLPVRRWFIPLGLVHADHRVTALACRALARRSADREWAVYEDLPYALEDPGTRDEALAALAADQWVTEPLTPSWVADPEAKRAAAACYESQRAPMGTRLETALRGPERYHHLLLDAAVVS